jgi:DNA primase
MSQVDEVRAAADIVKVVGDYVKLRKAGANYMGLCPFHQEKTPSFAVHPAKQIFHCFGCGVGGDVFKFVMMIDNLTFPEALRRLAEKVGVTLSDTFGQATYDANARVRAALYKMHEAAAKFFAGQLSGTAEGRLARAYLEDRGLTDEVVGRFRLGYAPADGQALTRHLSGALHQMVQGGAPYPSADGLQGGALDRMAQSGAGYESELLEKSGLVVRDAERNRHYDRFRRRIIFPIANESGRIVAFAGRALGDEQPKYLNSPETPIYTKSRLLYHLERAGPAIRKADQAILVEGYMDCIAVAASGIENVVASCGTSLTESHIRILARYARRVVVNYDPDAAGMAAVERSIPGLLDGLSGFDAREGRQAISEGLSEARAARRAGEDKMLDQFLENTFEVRVLPLPVGLDPDSFIRKYGVAAYRGLLARAPTYVDYLTERAATAHDLGKPEGKVAVANAVLPYIAKVPNILQRAALVNQLAERLHLDQGLLREELRRGAVRPETRIQPESAAPKTTTAEKELLRAFMEDQGLADELLPQMVEQGMLEGLVTEPIFKRFLELRVRGESAEPIALEEPLSAEARRALYESLFWAVEPPDRGRIDRHLRALQARKARRQLDKLRGAIQEAIQSKDWEKVRQLEQSNAGLEKELRGLEEGRKMSIH